DAEPLSPAAGQARQGVRGRDRDEQRDRDYEHADECGVPEPAHEPCLGEQEPDVLERRREVEPEGVVLDRVEVDVLLERRDQHPEEGEREKPREEHEHGDVQEPRGDPSPPRARARVHTTSARCARRSIRYATSTSTGTRKSEMAAPAARSLPAMPVAKASDGSVCVESYGAPAVRMETTVMSVNVKMIPNRTPTERIGVIMGRLIWNVVRQKPAPSMAAASGISFEIAERPASMMTVENGIRRQQWTRITEAIARCGSPSHIGALYGLKKW